MQLVVKTSDSGSSDASPLIRSLVLAAAPILSEAVNIFVSKVFPTVTQGNRARIYTVKLPDDVSDEIVREILEDLGNNDQLEYVQVSAPKHPIKGD